MNKPSPAIIPPATIRTDLGAIFISLELSRSRWIVTSLSPSGAEKMSKYSVPGGDLAGLMERFRLLVAKAKARSGQDFPIVTIQEAGLDGFWIHRALEKEGIESHVVDPASIATSRARLPPSLRQVTRWPPMPAMKSASATPPRLHSSMNS